MTGKLRKTEKTENINRFMTKHRLGYSTRLLSKEYTFQYVWLGKTNQGKKENTAECLAIHLEK